LILLIHKPIDTVRFLGSNKVELPHRQVAGLLETGLERLEECLRPSTLPEAPDRAFAQDLVELYGRQVAA
jgi:hypothetical protein